MDHKTLKQFRENLVQHRNALLEWYNSDSSEKNLRLGGADIDEVLRVIEKLDGALGRIDQGDFGRCVKCVDGGEVESERLEQDFTTSVCISHYSEEQIRALERDLQLAAKVQRQLLPRYVPALRGIDIAAYSEPAHIVGGDYYDFFRSHDGLQGIIIADVMGKGLAASMLMSNLQASLRILGPEYNQPHQLIARLNELFRYNLRLIRFISIFLGRIDAEAGTLQYCNAGHHPPLRWDAVAKSLHWLQPSGPAIGLLHQPQFNTESIELNAGDFLLLYTDGLVEARNAAGEEFGEKRLEDFMIAAAQKSAGDFLSGLRHTLTAFAGKEVHDDLTMMAIKVG